MSEQEPRTSKELLPCPFCGGEAEYEEVTVKDSDEVWWSVGCKLKLSEHDEDDSCCGYQPLKTYARKSEALAAWNKRHTLEPLQRPTHKGDPIRPVWSYKDRCCLYPGEAWRLYAMDLEARTAPPPSDAPVLRQALIEIALTSKCATASHGEWCDGIDIAQRAIECAGVASPKALLDVATERERQKSIEGWTPEHDDEHRNEEMAAAAAAYAAPEHLRMYRAYQFAHVPMVWPWDVQWWKPKDRRRDLVRAGALILAEIERLDRAGLTKCPDQQHSTADLCPTCEAPIFGEDHAKG